MAATKKTTNKNTRTKPASLQAAASYVAGNTNMSKNSRFNKTAMLFLVTVFQALSFFPIAFDGGAANTKLVYTFAGYIAAEWLYITVAAAITKSDDFRLEIIAFFLSGIGLAICGSIYDEYAVKQAAAIGLGLAAFSILTWVIRNADFAMLLHTPVAIASLGLLGVNLIMAKTINGALNWINIGSFSIQPSELVKIAFVFVGAATLEKLQTTRGLTKYVLFSIGCVGALFLMLDFGTALIFFFTFIIIAFMRSGDVRTIILACAVALLGAVLVIYFKPYVATRFATYRHAWDFINDSGFQQTRVMIYGASGGLLGLGIGRGKLRTVFAASTDLVFGMICEEWGILLAALVVLVFAFTALFAVRGARKSFSTFYSIAAVSAAGMLLFQLSLNVFGVTDLLPMTGVTLPFISRGGTSLICSWSLFAFIKSVSFNTGTAGGHGKEANAGRKRRRS
ncbi:MAG: FtsW/RodA/SpoVE family cell cycle protein [Clostridiales bacterium]|nr:FtsW/RodA/SpoVE family cell cycle protein [Clostridiales bacterium]